MSVLHVIYKSVTSLKKKKILDEVDIGRGHWSCLWLKFLLKLDIVDSAGVD